MDPRAQAYDREAVAQRLSISLRKTDEILLSGQLRSFRIGRRRLVSEKAIEDYIRRREQEAR